MRQQLRHRHQDPRRAEAALQAVQFMEGLLDRMQGTVGQRLRRRACSWRPFVSAGARKVSAKARRASTEASAGDTRRAPGCRPSRRPRRTTAPPGPDRPLRRGCPSAPLRPQACAAARRPRRPASAKRAPIVPMHRARPAPRPKRWRSPRNGGRIRGRHGHVRRARAGRGCSSDLVGFQRRRHVAREEIRHPQPPLAAHAGPSVRRPSPAPRSAALRTDPAGTGCRRQCPGCGSGDARPGMASRHSGRRRATSGENSRSRCRVMAPISMPPSDSRR